MIPPHLWLGWGAGGYRYFSPDYFNEEYYFHDSHFKGGLTTYTDYAHIDWLQFPMEFGLLGSSLLLGILVYWFGYALWLGRRMQGEGWVILLGAAALLVHALVDFPLYNSAILTLFCLLVASTIKTASLEGKSITRHA